MVSSNLYGERLMIQVLEVVRKKQQPITVVEMVYFLLEKEPEKPEGNELKNLVRRTRECALKIADTGLIKKHGALCKTKGIFYYKFSN